MSWYPTLSDLTALAELPTENKPSGICYFVLSEQSWYFLDKDNTEPAQSPVVIETDVSSSRWIQFAFEIPENDNPLIPQITFTRIDAFLPHSESELLFFLVNQAKSFYCWDGKKFDAEGSYFRAVPFNKRSPFVDADKFNQSFFVADNLLPGKNYTFSIHNQTQKQWLKTGSQLKVYQMSKTGLWALFSFLTFSGDSIVQKAQNEKIRAEREYRAASLQDNVWWGEYLDLWSSIPVEAIILEIMKQSAVAVKQVDFDEPFALSLDTDDCILCFETTFQQSSGALSFRAYLPCVYQPGNTPKQGGAFVVQDPEDAMFNYYNGRTEVLLGHWHTFQKFPNFPEVEYFTAFSVVDVNHHPYQLPINVYEGLMSYPGNRGGDS